MTATVVLASGSVTRASLLRGAGVAFEAIAPGVDETALKRVLLADGFTPRDVADALAEVKALRVSTRTAAMVIGADQTLEFRGRLFDKPANLAEARAQLETLRGGVHSLHSAVVVAREGVVIWREVKTARLTMRAFSDAFLDGLLQDEGEAALASAGSYRIEGPGVQLFERIEGDTFTIMGLPLLGLLDLLRRHGLLAL